MPVIDKQNRITIPLDLWNMVEESYPTRSLAFCIEDDRILLLDANSPEIYYTKVMLLNIAIDAKRRFSISTDIARYLGLESFIVIYAQKGLLYLEAPPNHSTKKD